MAYTQKQREWYYRVYGRRCAFHYLKDGVWRRCPRTIGSMGTRKMHVHHIIPQRWSKRWLPGFSRDTCLNGCLVCINHHIIVHPDLGDAYDEYRTGNKLAFKLMVAHRDELVAQGIPYWNTTLDWMFNRLVKKYVFGYIAKHPDDLFPKRRRRR